MYNSRKRNFIAAILFAATTLTATADAADYEIDPAHSFVQFRTQHLGFSWLVGRFNEFAGAFKYDGAAPSEVTVEIQTASVDSNHAERDKHLRSDDFLDVKKYPRATFVGTAYEGDVDNGELRGELTLHGVTQPVVITMKKIGEGDDPWGGYRVGFEGFTVITRADFGMTRDLGPGARDVELALYIEGVRQ